MNAILRFALIVMLTVSGAVYQGRSQSPGFRPPAIPLVTCDPYFSIWSFANTPTDDWARHWTGTVNALCGMVRVDNRTYRLLGTSPAGVPAMPFNNVTLTPTRTMYEFSDSNVCVTLTFMTPALPYDLEVYARPVTYVSWQVHSLDTREHSVSLYFDNTAELVVNTPDQPVSWSRVNLRDLDVLRIGSQEQRVLGRAGDDLRIDWGYLYVVSPHEQHATSSIGGHAVIRTSFADKGSLPVSDDLRMPRPADDNWPVLAYAIDVGRVGAQAVERFIVLAYDDLYSIEYLQRKLLAYWKAGGMTTAELLDRSVKEYPTLAARCKAFDTSLQSDLLKTGGERYARLATLAYRQAIAAHKLTADIDGTPMLFPKENFSNGCISTVDVIYPAAPIFLLFNGELAKASVRPVLAYAMTKRWRFPFAPHDLGTYPLANGQVYGGGETSEENQMPVEESANMILLMYAIARIDNNAGYAETFWPALQQWAVYLKEKGLDPENQLCTDDFAGHLAHNTNLSLKAILALGAYSRLCTMAHKSEEAKEYHSIAAGFAKRWIAMADDGDHYRLAFDKPGTWSQKYNLVWDHVLDLNLFPEAVAQKEIRFYRTKLNTFGLPLDNRKEYTKLDWVLWTATLAESQEGFDALVAGAYEFADKTPDRVPLSDWYDTKTAKQIGFQARPVVGGLFMKMLAVPEVWKKWQTHR
jgi:hypothetical protein